MKSITMKELNELIDRTSDSHEKKTLLIVKGYVKTHEGPIEKDRVAKIVTGLKKTQDVLCEFATEEDLDEVYLEAGALSEAFGKTITLMFTEEE